MSRRTSTSVLTRWLAVAAAVGLLAGCGKKEEPQDTGASGAASTESPATSPSGATGADTGTGAAGTGSTTGGATGTTGSGTGGAAGTGAAAGGTGGADMSGTTGGAAGATGSDTGAAGTGAAAGGATGAGASGTSTGTDASAGGTTKTAATGGEALLKSSDCFSCHAVDHKVVGPAYSWVAYKYKGQSGADKKLAAKIKAGGSGNWNALTGGVPMTPHPQLSDAEAKAMADWVLKQTPVKPPKA